MECVVTRTVTLWGDVVYWRSVMCVLILIRGTAQHPQKSCCRTRPLCCQQWEDSRRPTASHPVSLRQCANVRLTAVGPGPSMTGLGRELPIVMLRHAEHLRGKRTHLALHALQTKVEETGIELRKKMLPLPIEIELRTRSNRLFHS